MYDWQAGELVSLGGVECIMYGLESCSLYSVADRMQVWKGGSFECLDRFNKVQENFVK